MILCAEPEMGQDSKKSMDEYRNSGGKMKERFSIKRMGMTLFGVVLCAISVGFFKNSNFGVDPFQSFAMGLFGKAGFGLSYGLYYILLNFVLLAIVFFMDRNYIGLATFINIFLVGYIVDFSSGIIKRAAPEPSLLLRIIFLVIGIVVMCFASAFYYTADLGVSTYDAIPLFLAKRNVWKFRYLRISTDLLCILVGFLCGVTIGVGTVVTAFFMGPLIDFFNIHCAIPFLNSGRKKVSS